MSRTGAESVAAGVVKAPADGLRRHTHVVEDKERNPVQESQERKVLVQVFGTDVPQASCG